MSDDNHRHGRGFQPIEPVGGAAEPRRPAPATPPSPPPVVRPAPPPDRATAPAARTSPEPSANIEYAARFGSAAAALVYCSQLRAIGGADGMTFRTGRDHSWWAVAHLDLDRAREFTRMTRGEGYVGVGTPTKLVPDVGWGEAPTAAVERDPRAVRMDTLTAVEQIELIRVAGLRQRADHGLREVSILLSGSLVGSIVRRAADLGLGVTHRIVRLGPLFTNNGRGRPAPVDPLTLVELRVRASTGEVPRGLVRGLAGDTRFTVCRRVSGGSEVLIEHGYASPLPDRQLADVALASSWLLSRGSLGARTVEPVGGFIESASLLRLSDGQGLDDQEPDGDLEDDENVRPLEVRLVRARTPGQAVDALLLASGDLKALGLVLEGHPLAESAMIVRGRDRHLLLAPGGLLEELPVGEPLYCLGPGLFYLPLGRGTKPRVPTGARRELFDIGEHTPVVLMPDGRLRFDLKWSEPVWRLWVGPPPPIDDQLPDTTLRELEDIDRPPQLEEDAASETTGTSFFTLQSDPADAPGQGSQDSSAPSPAQGRGTSGSVPAGVGARAPARPTRTRTWLDDAWQAERRGDLKAAAALHERHGDPLRAARLYERAFQLGTEDALD
jgi:hypothetical protein